MSLAKGQGMLEALRHISAERSLTRSGVVNFDFVLDLPPPGSCRSDPQHSLRPADNPI